MELRRMNRDALVFELTDKEDIEYNSFAIPLERIDMDLMEGKTPKELWLYRVLKTSAKIYKMKWRKFMRETAIGDIGLIEKNKFEKTYKTLSGQGI